MKLPGIIALVNCDEELVKAVKDFGFPGIDFIQFDNGIQLNAKWQKHDLNILAIIAEAEILSASGIALKTALENRQLPSIPFILIAVTINEALLMMALNAGITEVFHHPVSISQLQEKLNFLLHNWDELIKNTASKKITVSYKIPVGKRIFDILFSLLALLLLSPLFLLFALFIKLESKGPVFYYSLRAGSGYKIFKFYKFRSMYVDADKRLKELGHLNQYKNNNEKKDLDPEQIYLCKECAEKGRSCQYPMFADTFTWCEKAHPGKGLSAAPAFIKIKDDPRVTKAGSLMRNTSIDELPQLINVLKGDMSIVGNRPLPLYEAEKLTTDKYVLRFLAPAGLTGLWQVEKRGKAEMSEEERLMLDNAYAENYSLLGDIKLLFKTIPALFQKEKV